MELNNFSVGVITNSKLVEPKENGYVFLEDEDEYNISLTNNNKSCRCDAEIKIDDVSMGLFRIDNNKTVIIERSSKTNNRFKFVSESSSIVDEVYGGGADQKRKSSHNGEVSVIFKLEHEPKPNYVTLKNATHDIKTDLKPTNVKSPWTNNGAGGGGTESLAYGCEEEEEEEEYFDMDMGGGMNMFGYDDEDDCSYDDIPVPIADRMTGFDEEEDCDYNDVPVDENMTTISKKCAKRGPKAKSGMTVLSDKLSKQTFTTVAKLNYDSSKETTINLRLVTDQNKNSSKHKSLESINNSTPMPAKP
jgi:hypothetical protein